MTAKKSGGNRRRKGEGSIFEEPSRNGWRYDGPEGTIRAKGLEGPGGLHAKVQRRREELGKKFRAPDKYTLAMAIDAWLDELAEQVRDGEAAPRTHEVYNFAGTHLKKDVIERDGKKVAAGTITLNDLCGDDVRKVLRGCREGMTTQSLTIVKLVAKASVRLAATKRLADADIVASIEAVKVPQGKSEGRPTKAMTLEQFLKLLEFSCGLWNEPERPDRDAWLWPYVALTLLCGVRAEEARALTWADVDLEEGVVWVRRAERFRGDTKTPSSRRRLGLHDIGIQALKEQAVHQARLRVQAGEMWADTRRVYTSALGAGFNDDQVRHAFKRLCYRAGIGENWVPRETRKSFATILKGTGLEVDDIAAALGHADNRTTKKFYIEEAVPLLVTTHQKAMAELLSKAKLPNSLPDVL